MNKHNINTRADIEQMVNTFYGRVREDALLGPIFEEKIKDNWPRHLDIMYRFWETVLLEDHTYYGSPFIKHAPLPVEKGHFNRWIQIFTETVDSLFEGAKADEAKWRAEKMAEMFNYKIEYMRSNKSEPLH